jgi:sugar-specific transcriptional regulator TrmB
MAIRIGDLNSGLLLAGPEWQREKMKDTQNDILDKLKGIGLTKSEAEFYLANLSMGPATAIQLGEHLGHTRQMVYNILPSLLEKGVVKKTEIGGRRLFEAVSPEVLVDRAQEITQNIKDIIPVLKTRRAEYSSIPKVTVYENPLAMREWYRSYMGEAKMGDELLVWSTGKHNYWYEMDREFYDNYLKFSEKKGIKTFVILPDTEEAREYQKSIGRKGTHVKFLKDPWETLAEKWIWKDQVCYLTIKDNATNMIVLESHELAEIERFDFAHLWQK